MTAESSPDPSTWFVFPGAGSSREPNLVGGPGGKIVLCVMLPRHVENILLCIPLLYLMHYLGNCEVLRANCWNVFGHTERSSHTIEEPSYKIQVSFKENLTFALSACDEIAKYTVYTLSALSTIYTDSQNIQIRCVVPQNWCCTLAQYIISPSIHPSVFFHLSNTEFLPWSEYWTTNRQRSTVTFTLRFTPTVNLEPGVNLFITCYHNKHILY